jgi:3-hydroxyanthranilate 3,4-dioxygenase
MSISPPFNLLKWIDERRHLLRPNLAIWQEGDLIIQVIGGPSSRTDYHVDAYEELFYQLKGDVTIKIIDEGKRRDIMLREGEIFMLPAFVPHSPQRPAGSIGLVVEHPRAEGVMDAFEWFCESCDTKIHRAEVPLKDIVSDLPKVFKEYNDNEKFRTCPSCGTVAKGTDYGKKILETAK